MRTLISFLAATVLIGAATSASAVVVTSGPGTGTTTTTGAGSTSGTATTATTAAATTSAAVSGTSDPNHWQQQQQQQQQQQLQQQANSSANTNTNNVGSTTVWAPVIHGQTAAPLAGASLVVMPMSCGPRVRVVREPVIGKRFGIWGGQSDVEQGYTEYVVSEDEPFRRHGSQLFGHEVMQYTAVLGTSTSGSFSLGGAGRHGDAAQGGGAAGGQMQQMVSHFTVRDCVMAVETPPVAPPPPPPPVPEFFVEKPIRE